MSRIAALCVRARPRRGAGYRLRWGAGFLASSRRRPLEKRGGRKGGGSGGRAARERREEEAAAAAARRGGGEGRAGRGGPGAPRREGPREAGAGAGGVGGGRVGGERESNSRTRPERPAQRAQAARLSPAPKTGGCGGRGLHPSPIRRSGSEVSTARAATTQRRAPQSPKWLQYPESRPAGIRTWAGAAALSGCRAAGADGEGAPSTKAWRGSGGLPTWAGPRPGWTLPSLAVSELPAARGWVAWGGGFLRSRHSGLGAGPNALQGQRVSEVKTRLTQPGLQADWARLGVQIRARKSLQRDGRASRDAHPRVRDRAGGAGALVVVPSARGLEPPGGPRGDAIAASGSLLPGGSP